MKIIPEGKALAAFHSRTVPALTPRPQSCADEGAPTKVRRFMTDTGVAGLRHCRRGRYAPQRIRVVSLGNHWQAVDDVGDKKKK
jgi:hypothetical protein